MSTATAMTHATWATKRWLINLRWPGLVGVGLLLFTAGLTVVVIQSAQHRLRGLDEPLLADRTDA